MILLVVLGCIYGEFICEESVFRLNLRVFRLV